MGRHGVVLATLSPAARGLLGGGTLSGDADGRIFVLHNIPFAGRGGPASVACLDHGIWWTQPLPTDVEFSVFRTELVPDHAGGAFVLSERIFHVQRGRVDEMAAPADRAWEGVVVNTTLYVLTMKNGLLRRHATGWSRLAQVSSAGGRASLASMLRLLGSNARSMGVDPKGRVWVVESPDSVGAFFGEGIVWLTDSCPVDPKFVRPSGDGTIWAAGTPTRKDLGPIESADSLAAYDGRVWTLHEPEELAERAITDLATAGDDTPTSIWAATDAGLVIQVDGQWHAVGADDGASLDVQALATEPGGAIWGVARTWVFHTEASGQRWQTHRAPRSALGRAGTFELRGLVITPEGHVLVRSRDLVTRAVGWEREVTYGQGSDVADMAVGANGLVGVLHTPSPVVRAGEEAGRAEVVCREPDGTWSRRATFPPGWQATSLALTVDHGVVVGGRGSVVLDATSPLRETVEAPEGGVLRDVEATPDGVWGITASGLWRLGRDEGSDWQPVYPPGASGDPIVLALDDDHSLWVAFERAVAQRHAAHAWTVWTAADGVPAPLTAMTIRQGRCIVAGRTGLAVFGESR